MLDHRLPARITPAYAGKRTTTTATTRRRSDHPRVRGEEDTMVPSAARRTGSPPRTRGRGVDPRQDLHPVRITPAYAGKRSVTSATSSPTSDHPRVRGEEGRTRTRRPGLVGSPPRTRGRADWYLSTTTDPWITPAYAGKRASTPSSSVAAADHPRVRGEEAIERAEEIGLYGSPPRTRGRGGSSKTTTAAYRITPAYAGKRWPGRRRAPPPPDHPRVRGEETS